MQRKLISKKSKSLRHCRTPRVTTLLYHRHSCGRNISIGMRESALLHCLSQIICLMGGKSSSGSDPVYSQSEVCIFKFVVCLILRHWIGTTLPRPVMSISGLIYRWRKITFFSPLLCAENKTLTNTSLSLSSPRREIVAKFFLKQNEVIHSDEDEVDMCSG